MPKLMPRLVPKLKQSHVFYVLLALVSGNLGPPEFNFRLISKNTSLVCLLAEAQKEPKKLYLSILPEVEESEDEQHGYRKKNHAGSNSNREKPFQSTGYHCLDENRKNLQRQAVPLFVWHHSWKTHPEPSLLLVPLYI